MDRTIVDDKILFYGLLILLMFAPVYWGGNRAIPLLIMELGAVVLLARLAWRSLGSIQPLALSWPVLCFLAGLVLLPLMQMVPVPLALWADLPGREFYAEALHLAGADGEDFGWRAISLIPSATEATWLALLPPVTVFLVASELSGQRLLALVRVFLGIAAAEALLGLIQYGDGPNSVFRLGNTWMGDSASGTYMNRNHLAGLLEMALPLALALLMATVGQGLSHTGDSHGRRKQTFRQWLVRFSVSRIHSAVLYGAVALLILLGLVFTRSRAGISLAMLGILLCAALFSSQLGRRSGYGLMGSFAALGIGLAGLIGLAPVWSRFTYSDPVEDGRWRIIDATLQAVGTFFPLGSGGGTFEDVFRRFHPLDFPGVTVNRAHNDYLEWLLEYGLLAGLLIAVWLIFYLRQWRRVWVSGAWMPLRFAQVGSGIALLLMMLHTLVDYNLRIPANALFMALLAALFFHRANEAVVVGRTTVRRRRKSRRSRKDPTTAPLPAREIPPENRINPFAS